MEKKELTRNLNQEELVNTFGGEYKWKIVDGILVYTEVTN